MLDLRTAVSRVLSEALPLATEVVLLPAAAGRVLAADVRARSSLPAWPNSAMDGYAARSNDVGGASATDPVRLSVIETVVAGGVPSRAVGPMQAVRIMTGAPMPAGADCVVRVEDSDDGRKEVLILSDRDAGRNLRPAGEDVQHGAVALPAGTMLRGAQLAFLAALGEQTVIVRRRPRVALLASGDELVPLERACGTLREGAVIATNSLALTALLRADGAEPVDLGIASDSTTAIAESAARAAGCDLLVTTGGASVGDHDHARAALAAHGLAMDFWRVRVRPGSQTAFGRLRALGDMPWLGLPGNPVSAQVTYELFVRPLVRLWLGHRHLFRAPLLVTLDEPVKTSDRDCLLLRVRLTTRDPSGDDGRWHARLTGPQGSNLLHSMAHANALLVVPAGRGVLPAGARCHSLPLHDGAFHTAAVPW